MTDDAAPPERVVLTREALLDGSLAALMVRSMPELRLLTDEERAASLDDTLAARPPPMPGAAEGVWVFAYGSLIWNPTFHFVEQRAAAIRAWHRSFCLGVKLGRGTPENPGLMLGLRPGGICEGAAFRIAQHEMAQELSLIWRREMVADGYIPVWATLEHAGVPFGHAIAFAVNPDGPAYTGDLPEDQVVRRLATARGALGTGAEYLFRTQEGLRLLGIADPLVDRLASQVAAHAASDENGAPQENLPRPM